MKKWVVVLSILLVLSMVYGVVITLDYNSALRAADIYKTALKNISDQNKSLSNQIAKLEAEKKSIKDDYEVFADEVKRYFESTGQRSNDVSPEDILKMLIKLMI